MFDYQVVDDRSEDELAKDSLRVSAFLSSIDVSNEDSMFSVQEAFNTNSSRFSRWDFLSWIYRKKNVDLMNPVHTHCLSASSTVKTMLGSKLLHLH